MAQRFTSGSQVEFHKGTIPVEQLKEKIKSLHVIGIRWTSLTQRHCILFILQCVHIGRSGTKLTKEILELGNHLLCVGCFCIGSEQVDGNVAQKLGVNIHFSLCKRRWESRELEECILVGTECGRKSKSSKDECTQFYQLIFFLQIPVFNSPFCNTRSVGMQFYLTFLLTHTPFNCNSN